MQKFISIMSGFGLIVLLALTLGFNVNAQDNQESQPAQTTTQQSEMSQEFSDEQLEKVAAAYAEIFEIRVELQDSLAEVTDQEASQRLHEQAGAAMVEAIQDNDLTLTAYNEVMEAVQTDLELRERLIAKLQEIQ
ncbi:protein of unknown function [Desulfonatronum thiosulfatophilum]|uniref:DUF4168 domain-containing protein n=1 Tax=Desulfonatronum thiosulfatophilum TaxID=617002 RepID=A0A1G6EGE7_9BACT|nr:DUF4168 domain-containing protein [Desulfonatronum thiosulfatophilum]SDB56543.1 protein of unknown function [Desulfonatronum thiosulfatophilum]